MCSDNVELLLAFLDIKKMTRKKINCIESNIYSKNADWLYHTIQYMPLRCQFCGYFLFNRLAQKQKRLLFINVFKKPIPKWKTLNFCNLQPTHISGYHFPFETFLERYLPLFFYVLMLSLMRKYPIPYQSQNKNNFILYKFRINGRKIDKEKHLNQSNQVQSMICVIWYFNIPLPYDISN